MNPMHDPLSPEERALAERLARLSPHGEPPATLDAAILRAAHAASPPSRTRRQGRRWWAAAAVPGGFITAVGTAAAFVFAVGLVWQLRPGERPEVPRETRGDDGFVAVEMIAAPADARSDPSPPPGTGKRAAAPAMPDTRSGVGDAVSSSSPAPAQDTAGEPAMPAHVDATDASPQQAAVPPGPETAAPSIAAPIERAMAPVHATAPEQQAQSARTRAPRRATYTTAARARAEAARSSAPIRNQRDPEVGEHRTPASADNAASPSTGQSGDGAVAAMPVALDGSLAPADWLERIRLRRAEGDLESAGESLRLFRRSYPRIPVPRDLRDLPR